MNSRLFTSFIFVVSLAVICAASSNAYAARFITNSDIESYLLAHDEPGYSYVERLQDGIWFVEYMRPDWGYSWEIAVTTTSTNPQGSLVVIGTTLFSVKDVTGEFLLQLLHENSFDANPGSYSVFIDENNEYFIQYSVKIPQTLMTREVLIEGIGFVAGYANKRYPELEKLVYGKPQPVTPPEQQSRAFPDPEDIKEAYHPQTDDAEVDIPPIEEPSQENVKKNEQPVEPLPPIEPEPEPEPVVAEKPAPEPEPEPQPTYSYSSSNINISETPVAPPAVITINELPGDLPANTTLKTIALTEMPLPENGTLEAETFLEDENTVSIIYTRLVPGQLVSIYDNAKKIADVKITSVGFLSAKGSIINRFADFAKSYLIGNSIGQGKAVPEVPENDEPEPVETISEKPAPKPVPEPAPEPAVQPQTGYKYDYTSGGDLSEPVKIEKKKAPVPEVKQPAPEPEKPAPEDNESEKEKNRERIRKLRNHFGA